MKLKILVALFLGGSLLSGTIFHEIDTTKLLRCTFSSQHHNRIAVDEGRIKKVIFSERDLSIRLEEESGQIFVQTPFSDKAETTLSIVTEEGVIQDISLLFDDRESETLILRKPKLQKPISQPKHTAQKILRIVEQIRLGETPDGFHLCTASQETRCIEGISAKRAAKVIGEDSHLNVWELTNSTKQRRQLEERIYNFDQGAWVYLDKHSLSSGERTLLIIGDYYE